MLVLTRKVNEVILINDSVEIKIVSIDGNHVRIGVNAPKSVTIHRKEVYDKIKEENRSALESAKGDLSEALTNLRKKLPKK